MMFVLKKISCSVTIFLFTILTILTFTETSSISKINYDNLKNKFIKETSAFKLQNYLKKLKLNKMGLIDVNKGQDFIFIDSNDKDRLILNNIKEDDINFDKMGDQNDLDEFKARIFAYIFKNRSGKDLFKPIGVNFDDEKVPGWRIYLVLMNSVKDSKHKLLKVCIRENSPHDNFALIMNFDNSCKEIINILKQKAVLSDNNPEYTNKLRMIQSKLLDKELKKKLEKSKNLQMQQNIITNNNRNSFIEKSSTTIEAKKTFSIDTLAHKFSVEELAKIKYLIKFAKGNKILDHIYSKKGNLKIEDLVSIKIPDAKAPTLNSTEHISKITSSNFTSILNITNVTSTLKSEIDQLKSVIKIQNKKLEENYNEIKENVKNMKDMILFVKELSGEFHKSMLFFGNTLNKVNSELTENRKAINKTTDLAKEIPKILLRQEEIEKERKKDRELDRQKETEREKERQKELEKERQREIDREKVRNEQWEKHIESEKQKEWMKDREYERIKEKERELERQREKHREKEREFEKQKERDREREKEKEREREKESVREREIQRKRENELEKERQIQRDIETKENAMSRQSYLNDIGHKKQLSKKPRTNEMKKLIQQSTINSGVQNSHSTILNTQAYMNTNLITPYHINPVPAPVNSNPTKGPLISTNNPSSSPAVPTTVVTAPTTIITSTPVNNPNQNMNPVTPISGNSMTNISSNPIKTPKKQTKKLLKKAANSQAQPVPTTSSPFLSANIFDSMEDDDELEAPINTNTLKKSQTIDDTDEFINP